MSLRALDELPGIRAQPQSQPETEHQSPQQEKDGTSHNPEALLWAALCLAPPGGISVPDLMREIGMSRRWIYYRLRTLADTGQVIRTEHGTWRPADSDGDAQ